MIAVAIIAVLLGATKAVRRWNFCRNMANYHAAMELTAIKEASRQYGGLELHFIVETAKVQAEHHARFKREYLRVAYRPWLPIPNEVPPPEPFLVDESSDQ